MDSVARVPEEIKAKLRGLNIPEGARGPHPAVVAQLVEILEPLLGNAEQEEPEPLHEELKELAARLGVSPGELLQATRERLGAVKAAAPDPAELEARIRSLPRGEIPPRETMQEIISALADVDEISRLRLIDLLAKHTRAPRQDLKRWVQQAARERAAQAAAQQGRRAEDDADGAKLRDALRDVPIPDWMPADLTVPPGYHMSEANGVLAFHVGKHGEWTEEVFPAPLVVVSRLEDADQETVWLELAYCMMNMNGSCWRRLTVRQDQAVDPKKVLELAQTGFPVHGQCARQVGEYIVAFLMANPKKLPTERAISRLGWRKVGTEVRCICGPAQAAEAGLRIVPGVTPGERQVVTALRDGGTWGGWLELFRFVREQSLPARLCVYVSLASPVFAILHVPSVVLHLCNITTRGKTTAQQVGASCWGYPGGHGADRDGLLLGWNMTKVGAERLAALLQHLPLFLDGSETETLTDRDKKDLAERVYMLANGVGRTRGAPRGLQSVSTWQLAVISSGEEPLRTCAARGGLQARVIDWWVEPFAAAEAAERARALALEHYGHAGPRFARALEATDHAALRARFHEAKAALRAAVPKARGDIAARLVPPLAAALVAAELFHHQVLADDEPPETLEDFFAACLSDILAGDAPEHAHIEAYRHFWGWVERHRPWFEGSPDQAPNPPAGGWLGRWSHDALGYTNLLAVPPDVLRRALKECDESYSYGNITKAWLSCGWCAPGNDGRGRLVKVGESWAWCIRRPKDVRFDANNGGEDDEALNF
jgi:hypothetical protein